MASGAKLTNERFLWLWLETDRTLKWFERCVANGLEIGSAVEFVIFVQWALCGIFEDNPRDIPGLEIDGSKLRARCKEVIASANVQLQKRPTPPAPFKDLQAVHEKLDGIVSYLARTSPFSLEDSAAASRLVVGEHHDESSADAHIVGRVAESLGLEPQRSTDIWDTLQIKFS